MGQYLTGVFVNDNQPPHHNVVQNLTGNYEAGIISANLGANPTPAQLHPGQRYTVGSNERMFYDARYKGSDGTYLSFQYP